MAGFTKLVPEIVQSSIWNEPSDVRIVWITLLAIKDEEGNVRGNVQTLARLANVPDTSVQEALKRFQEPDPYSNTPTNEGRRIESIPGGWHVINHSIYRAKDYKQYEAERKREYRKKKCPGQVPDASASASVSVNVIGESAERGEPKKPSVSYDALVESGDIPANLANPDFAKAWGEFLAFRAERRKKVTPRSASMLLKKLSQWGNALAIESIEQSIANGWQGVFEPAPPQFKRQASQPSRFHSV